VYINDKTATPLTFTQPDLTLESQPGMGQLTIADFDGDGTLDLLFPVCSTSSSKPKTRGSKDGSGAACSSSTIHVVYNIQMPLCQGMFGSSNPVSLATMSESESASGSESKPCRQQDAMCTADPDYYISSLSATSNQAHHVVVDLSSGSAGLQFGTVVSNPLTLRYGDYNFDGYPDLLIPVVTTNGDRVVQLWENVACTEETCGEMATGFDHRTFQLVDDSTTAVLATILNAYAGAFFDFDEDGSLDILLLVDSGLNDTSPAVKSTVGVFNNIYTDAYFLKTLGLNGLCPAWCDEGVKFPDPKPYGVNLPGGTFKFTVTDLSGDPRAAIGTQLTQSSYLPLQTPYLLFGLGRTNNYIDNLFYGVTIQNEYEQHFAYFICVIPNSQIVAIPYPSSDPAQWILELYINPSEFTLWVVVAILVSLFLLFLVIMFFRRREKVTPLFTPPPSLTHSLTQLCLSLLPRTKTKQRNEKEPICSLLMQCKTPTKKTRHLKTIEGIILPATTHDREKWVKKMRTRTEVRKRRGVEAWKEGKCTSQASCQRPLLPCC
jgi:integrin alpha FG-GAP repeat containing protein 1